MRVVWWTIAFRFVVSQDATSSMISALHIRTRVHLALLAETAPLRITDTSWITAAFVASSGQLPTHGIVSTWITKTSAWSDLQALHGWIANMSRWTRALGVPIQHATLRIDSARVDLQARILTGATLAALIRITVTVLLALERRALLRGLPTESIGAHAEHSMIRHAAHGILSAGFVAEARVQTLTIDARVVIRTVGIGSTPGHTSSSLAQLSRRTCAGVAAGTAFASGTRLTTSTLRVIVTSLSAEHAKLVALAVGVAALQRLLASGQWVALISVLAAALHSVINH